MTLALKQVCVLTDNLNTDLGPELQCLLKVKEYLDYVLIFQHAIINAN